MAARIIDGKAIAQGLRARIKGEVAELTARLGRAPGLTVVLVGDDPASQVYVRNKERAAAEVGMAGRVLRYPATVSAAELLEVVAGLNADPSVDGILVQLPLPRHIEERQVIEAVDPLKDVDGFHPINMGRLAAGEPGLVPCTPLGVIELLRSSEIATARAHAVVVGRSNIVGKPMALLLLRKDPTGDATVTVCHSATRDLPSMTRQADVLIVAMGRPEAIGPEAVKPGAAVIDVGMHRRADGSLCGDVQTRAVAEVAGSITPVPGGVGPMTIVMLLHNTLRAARLRHGAR